MICDNCGNIISINEGLHLIKWRENGQVIRFWICNHCWKKIYHAEKPTKARRGPGSSTRCNLRNRGKQ